MAQEAYGKTAKQLKKERTVAKSTFTKRANFLSGIAESLTETGLREEFRALQMEARKVKEANYDFGDGLLEDLKVDEGEEAELSEQQKNDLTKTDAECTKTLNEIKRIVQNQLWSRYGQEVLVTAIKNAESVCGAADATSISALKREGFEMQLSLVEKWVKEACEKLVYWELWIPETERASLEQKVRDLKRHSNTLEARRAEFVFAERESEEEKIASGMISRAAAASTPGVQTTPLVKFKPIGLPKFHGCKREFHRWKKDWESLQQQGEPTGSSEIKKLQLLDSMDEKISRDLRLSGHNTAEDIFRVLENRYGNKTTIALEIIEELERTPALRANQPRKVIELIQTVEKALADLKDLGRIDAIKNPLVTKTIESKLPNSVKRDWLVFMVEPTNNVTPDNHFDSLLKFLKTQEEIMEKLEQLGVGDKPEKPEKKFGMKYSSTRSTKQDGCCIVCGDERHGEKLFFCKQFKSLKLGEKLNAVKKLGACKKCLECHDNDECKTTYLCSNRDCRKGRSSDHHFYLCPRKGLRAREVDNVGKDLKKRPNLTEEQEQFLAELSPEMAQKCKMAFTNMNAVTNYAKEQSALMKVNELEELPVIMMLLEVTTNAGQKIGTLIDLASDTNYITHRAANRLKLRSENVTLVVHGVGGMTMTVNSKRYFLRVRVKTTRDTEKAHQLVCYGLDEIAHVHRGVKPEQLKKFFPDIELEDLKRPHDIELLISHREGRLAPQRVKIVEDLVLWEGPLGRTVAGTHPNLFEKVEMTTHMSKTHFARSMRTAAMKYEELTVPVSEELQESSTSTSNRGFLEWWKWDSIGAACEPKCGGCRCGQCQPGGKEMTLAEERELEIIKGGLTYVKQDSHASTPHWDAKYPWTIDPASLPNNRAAVKATFLRTERQLGRDPEWQEAYKSQVHEMVERGAAIKLTEEVKDKWKGPVWYVSHLVAPNPHSVTTPVRIVWNSSQRFGGVSMNDLLLKGPDVLNPIRAVLLRFRGGVHAALGDVKKMYNSVWLEERERHLHRLLWRDSPGDTISDYAITRVNIGDKPAGCIAQVAMRLTGSLPMFAHLKDERRVLEEDSYVDDILTSHNDLQELDRITAGVEEVLKAGGFALKPWVRSGQSGRPSNEAEVLEKEEKQSPTLILPNQMRDEDNKALGVGYKVEEDQLYVMTSINFSKRKKKMRVGKNLLKHEVRPETPNPLTRRELLSQVAGLYDPTGLVTPAKQKGAILTRKAFQEGGGGKLTQETWDKPLSDGLRGEAIQLFEEYVQLGQIRFPRSLTPANHKGKPYGITFSDGSNQTYGAVMYLRWETSQGIDVRLVESKAKLTPLNQKGEAVKSEICGAVFAARLRKYFEKHGRIEVERWFHLVDSQTVLGAVQRESYGYQTFFANRVGEIQKSGPVQDWWWIPGDLNIAEIITRGATPEDLKEDSRWQKGPEFLKRPVEEWPMKSSGEVAAQAAESVNKLQRKAFSAALTRSQAKLNQKDQEQVSQESDTKGEQTHLKSSQPRRKPTSGIVDMVDVEKFSSLSRLVKVIAWVWRAARKWLERKSQPKRQSKWEARSGKEKAKEVVLTVEEREDALRDLLLAAQEGTTFPITALNRLAVYKDVDSGLLLCGGRIQVFNEDKTAVPILPHQAWLSTLLAQEAHNSNHEGVAGTLLRMRKKAWVIQGRRLAKRMVDNCVLCRKNKARRCEQIMGDLPPERTSPAAPFEFTTADLFGPYQVRDEVKKRATLKVWGVVFCCMASRAIHTEVVSDQSSEGFLLAYQRFTSLRGHPRKLWFDPGTNFIGARPALMELYTFLERLNKTELEENAAKHGTEWCWRIHPADSPHRNGAAEAAVKIVKRALSNIGGDGEFTWSEFQTFLFMAGNLANERPIDARIQSQEDCVEYITPNTLLLGRANPRGDPGDFQFDGYPYKRLKKIQEEVSRFWKKWCELAGPNLFTRSKWHTRERNVAVGDVVWMADQNALRGQYKLARVVSVNMDGKGIVRDVHVKTFPSYPVPVTKKGGPKRMSPKIPATILHRDVRRLIVLIPFEETSRN